MKKKEYTKPFIKQLDAKFSSLLAGSLGGDQPMETNPTPEEDGVAETKLWQVLADD